MDLTVPQRLDDIFEQAAVGVAQTDTTGRYLLVNDRYCSMLGRTRAELLDIGLQDTTHPEDLPKSLDAFIRAMESGLPDVIEQCQLRPDGSAVQTSNSISVGRDEQGKPQFVLIVAQDISARNKTHQSLSNANVDLRLLLDSAGDGFYCVDREGSTTLCNAAFLRMIGMAREEEALGRNLHDLVRLSRSDATPYLRDEHPIGTAILSGKHVHVIDDLLQRADGTSFPVEYWARPIVNDGEIQGVVCTFVDLTERKRAEVRQQLLNHELAHRVKNTLAMVQAIVGQTLRNAATPRDAIQAINQRLVALGKAHNVLMQSKWGNAPLMDVVESALAAHGAGSQRIRISGPPIDLGAKASLAITMALHELCTNAAKYGALSNDHGSVSIDWAVTGGAADATFRMRWNERDGPPVAPPTRKGFGSRLVAEAIGADLRGRTELIFAPEGVAWTLEAPMAAVGQ